MKRKELFERWSRLLAEVLMLENFAHLMAAVGILRYLPQTG